ncbi:MAG: hypothetical protein OQL18_05950, partial [Deltaproteobacteria bacterium]|nr:hypothetical protein [Deltaproteobacteria bacterium]
NLFGLIGRNLDNTAETVLNAATALSPVLRHFLDELGFSQVWVRLQRNHTRDSQRLRAFHHWFDALRTRQLLMRAENDHSCSTETTVAELLRWGGAPALVEKNKQLGLLENLQGVG